MNTCLYCPNSTKGKVCMAVSCQTKKKNQHRIDSKGGYTKDNVRLVCIIVNFALSEFGDLSFDKMCKAYCNNLVR